MNLILRQKFAVTGLLLIGLMSPAILADSASAAGSVTPKPSATNPYGAGTVDPAGPNESILVITTPAKTQKFTLKELLSLKPIKISIFEPFVKKRQQFTVISFAAIFKKMGIKPSDKVVTRALNNYEYANTASEFTSATGYLAIKRNGADIPYDEGGPLRLVFPDSSRWSKSLDPWNWSLASITVRK